MSDTNHRTSDRRVSETYRSLATEKAPAHLDQEILRMARREGRTPYAAARAWMRPVTWAATIAICLAIVMQLTELPRDAVEFDLPAPSAESPPPKSAAPASAGAIRPQAEPSEAVPSNPQETHALRSAEAPATAGKAMSTSRQPARADEPGAVSAVGRLAGAGDEPGPVLPRRERAAVSAVSESESAATRLTAETMADDAGPLCAADIRESADRWHDCIEALRGSVAEDRLAREIADFDAAHPEYVPEAR